jgi:archaellum component FlaC
LYLEKFFKRLAGKRDIEDALQRLDKLTQEEARMAIAEVLRLSWSVDNKVNAIGNQIEGVNKGLQWIDDKVEGVDERVHGVDDKVKQVDDRVWVVNDNVKLIIDGA